MKKKTFLAAIVLPAALVAADTQWILEQSTLSYHVSHPLHETNGVSKAARGKGVCREAKCDFLVAVPVKSFDSGDSNRDLHMLQAARGAQFPLVQVRTHLPESARSASSIQLDLEIEFAGQKAAYKQIPFQLRVQGDGVKITGTIPATLSDFKIDPPKLLTVPVKNDLPIKVEMSWRPQ